MKFREIFRFEFAYQVRRVSTWLCFTVLFVFAFWMMVASKPTDEDVLQNAPFGIAFATVLGGAIWLLIAASVAGEAAARDVQTRMHSLTYTAPVSKAEYLGGRFLAAFVVNALMLLAVPAGILLGLYLPDMEPSLLGPFWPAAYLTAYGFIALPFAFVATAIQFSWAALSRRPMASYLASVLLFITSHFVLLIVAQLLGQWGLVRLLDLVGIGGIITDLGDTWTAIEKNTRLVGLDGTLLANRLIWLAVAVGVLAFTYLRFRLAHPVESTRRRLIRRRRDAQPAMPAETGIATSTRIGVPQVRQAFGFATYARQTLGITWTSFQTIAKSRGGLVLLVAIPTLVVVFMHEYVQLFGVPLLPRTGLVLTFLTAPLTNPLTPWVIIPLLIVLYAGDLVWRERDAGLGEITDAAPVPEWVLFLGKFLGLGLVLVAWLALLMAAGMLAQRAMGYRDLDVGLYLQVLFGLQLPEYLLFALLALVVHTVVHQKYVGHLVALLTLGFIGFASRLGIEHNLLVYGSSPGWSYTDMSGFGPSLGPWLSFKLYWAAWALLLAVAARLLWVRGRELGLRARLQTARHRFTPATAWVTGVAAGLILTLGGFVFYNTNVLNEYSTASERAERRAEYERRYGRYAGIPQPQLTGTNLHVEIYPERRAVEIRGTYRLVNRSAVPIDSIHVATVPGVETGAVTFDRTARRVLADEDFGHQIYTLKDPLQPGDSLRLSFAVHVEPRGFQNSGVGALVVANGTSFTNQDWLPAIGYQPSRELSSAGDRRAHGLAPRPELPSLYDIKARGDRADSDLIAFDAVVGTDADQVAVAPGVLRRTWAEGGRRYFHYATDAPIGNEYAFFSANYAVREGRWNDVAIQIYYHPGHTANLDRMLRSVRASLDYYTEQFGPYPYRHMSLVEHPGLGGMHAHASLITFQEGFSLFNLEDNPRSPDFPFSVVAHEVAHQWWGTQVAPARVEGAPLLSESLAEYSAFQVVKKTYGQEHLRRYLGQLRTRYEVPSTRGAVPLLRANDPFHAYYKGPFAMYAVSEYIGEERVNEALRRLLEKHPSAAPPLPTSLDLYRELQAVTPESLHYLLHDLFEANTYWELETERATAEQTGAGSWQVTLDVQARKVVVDEAGVETEVAMDDWVEIGVFAPAEEVDEPLYMQTHRIRSGTQTITVTVPRKPARAGIDPDLLLVNLETGDNIEEVEIER
jgi:ABC-type transport system involved in multi-copper enzyme maturation permease subunit